MGKNIILIGLPGAGKTTLGKLLSNIIGYRFIDSDAFIEEKTGKSITDLFQIGEDYFRNIESDAYKEIAEFEDTIVSTGGGVVKRNENIVVLKQSGTIYYIDRAVEDITHDIEVSHRPLLKDGLERIYASARPSIRTLRISSSRTINPWKSLPLKSSRTTLE